MSIKTLAPTYYTRLIETTKRIRKCNTFLNAGCGDGFFDTYIKTKASHLTSTDINSNDIKIAKIINPEVKYITSNICKLPFKGNSFDGALCVDVIEHIDDDNKAIQELNRVMKKNAELIITVPSSRFPITFDPINFFLKLFGKKIRIGPWGFGHKRLYSTKSLSKLLKRNGFEIKETVLLSKAIVGFFENGYLVNILQPLTKSDPLNQNTSKNDIKKIKSTVIYSPPKILARLRNIIIKLDKLLLKKSKYSIGILIRAVKK